MARTWSLVGPIFSALLAAMNTDAQTVSIDFSTASQYTDSFVETASPDRFGHSTSSGGRVTYSQAITAIPDSAGQAIYDTNPGNGVLDNATFLTETISLDAIMTTNRSNPVGILVRVQASGAAANQGILALADPNSGGGGSFRLRLYHGVDITSGLSATTGTLFYSATFNLATGSVTTAVGSGGTGAINTFSGTAHLTLQMTGGADPTFNLTATDADGLLASTGDQTLVATDDFNTAGAIGFFLNAFNNTGSASIDNFQAVPEPATFTMLIGGIGILAWFQRAGRQRHVG